MNTGITSSPTLGETIVTVTAGVSGDIAPVPIGIIATAAIPNTGVTAITTIRTNIAVTAV